jgi:hypothetical protein
LFEADMSPSNLANLAKSINAKVGMEFEMIVPDVETEEYVSQEDYTLDEPTSSIASICDFFNIQTHNRAEIIDKLNNFLQSEYIYWVNTRFPEIWDKSGKAYLTQELSLVYHFTDTLTKCSLKSSYICEHTHCFNP